MIRSDILKSLQIIAQKSPAEETFSRQPDEMILFYPDTKFLRIPEHGHGCIEVICVCAGKISCLVDQTTLRLCAGELLFLGPNSHRQACKTGRQDVAVSFLILPEFCNHLLSVMGERKSQLRLFLMDCLFGQNVGPGHLYFPVSGQVRIRNLIENLLLAQLQRPAGYQEISQMTMGLLFRELLEFTDALPRDRQEHLITQVLHYIDDNYASGQLTEAAGLLNYDISILSREIRRQTGRTFTELIQQKRMSQAATLLRTTDLTVENISRTVGYENISYFHRLFRAMFGMTPRQYRAAAPASDRPAQAGAPGAKDL